MNFMQIDFLPRFKNVYIYVEKKNNYYYHDNKMMITWWNEECRRDADKRVVGRFSGAVLNKKLINKVGSDNGSLEEAIIIKKWQKLFKLYYIKNYSNLLFDINKFSEFNNSEGTKFLQILKIEEEITNHIKY